MGCLKCFWERSASSKKLTSGFSRKKHWLGSTGGMALQRLSSIFSALEIIVEELYFTKFWNEKNEIV